VAERYAPKQYWRVTFLNANGKRRTVWSDALNHEGTRGLVKFYVCDKTGERPDPQELVIATPKDVVGLRVARMNLTYAELEVVTGKAELTK